MIDLTLSLYLSDFLSSFYASMQIEPPAFPRIFSEAFDSKEDESMCSEVPVGNATNTSSGFWILSPFAIEVKLYSTIYFYEASEAD